MPLGLSDCIACFLPDEKPKYYQHKIEVYDVFM